MTEGLQNTTDHVRRKNEWACILFFVVIVTCTMESVGDTRGSQCFHRPQTLADTRLHGMVLRAGESGRHEAHLSLILHSTREPVLTVVTSCNKTPTKWLTLGDGEGCLHDLDVCADFGADVEVVHAPFASYLFVKSIGNVCKTKRTTPIHKY